MCDRMFGTLNALAMNFEFKLSVVFRTHTNTHPTLQLRCGELSLERNSIRRLYTFYIGNQSKPQLGLEIRVSVWTTFSCVRVFLFRD